MSLPYYTSPPGNIDENEESKPLTPANYNDKEEWTPRPFFTLNNMRYASQSSIHASGQDLDNKKRGRSQHVERTPISVGSMAAAAFATERHAFEREPSADAVPSPVVEDLVEDMYGNHGPPPPRHQQSAPDVALFDEMTDEPSTLLDTAQPTSPELSPTVRSTTQAAFPPQPTQPSAPLTETFDAAMQASARTMQASAPLHASVPVFHPQPSAPDLSQLDKPSPSEPGGAYIFVSPPGEHMKLDQTMSNITSPSFSVQTGASQLHGLGIQSPESAYTNASHVYTQRSNQRRVSFDLEANRDGWDMASSRTFSVMDEENHQRERSSFSSMGSRIARIISRVPWRVWMRRANGQIDRVSNVTNQEMRHIFHTIYNTAIQTFGLSTVFQNLNDLKYLEQKHREKMDGIRKAHDEEHYDFALVLTMQEAYAFWTEHLDFRIEYLGEDGDSKPLFESIVESSELHEPHDPVAGSPLITPTKGIRNRHNRSSQQVGMSMETPQDQATPLCAPRTAPEHSSRTNFSRGLSSVGGSGRPTLKKRMSMFDRALDAFSPTGKGASVRGKKESDFDPSPTPNRSQKKQNPSMSSARRRWGNRAMSGMGGDLMSPPVRSIKKTSSVRKRLAKNITPQPSASNNEQETTSGKKRQKRNPNSLREEDIPTQVIPRGIAARTHGMERFLSALKRGIIVRRHRPNTEAVYCRLISNDGGDTIQYQHVDSEEAMLGFNEQRVRYNRNVAKLESPTFAPALSRRWSSKDLTNDDDETQAFSIPDFIAAKQYRQRQMEQQGGLKRKVTDIATQVANSGSFNMTNLIAVHPARHEDPRSELAEYGTASLRRSKSEYYTPHSFSLVTNTGHRWFKGTSSNKVASEKWHSGEGSEAQFRYFDFEAATEGEYWLIFRGFLLLHRDAASGRFAQQRAAGFGSNYSRREHDEHSKAIEEDAEDSIPDGSRLPKERFHEPPTVSWFEYAVAKIRKTDMSYMKGHAVEGAVPPPSDYFLGFRTPGTQIWSRLRQAGLDTQRIYALDARRVMLMIQCPSDRLMDVAEVLRIKLKARDGSFAPFREDNLAIFRPSDEPWSPYEDGASLFRSSERQTIIDFIIRSRIRDSGAELGQNTGLGKMVDRRVPLHMRERLDVLNNAWVYFWRRSNWIGRDGRSMTDGSEKVQMMPKGASSNSLRFASSDDLSYAESQMPPNNAEVPGIFYRLLRGCIHQPLDSVEQYFGEKVAYYFVWLQHCSIHLMFLSVVGLIVFICQLSSGRWDHPLRPFFSCVVMIWSFVVMSNWRKRSNFLAFRWGTMNLKQQETTRPQFKGEYQRDEITGEWIVYYPSWKRWLKYLISFPLTLAFTALTMWIILLVHANRDYQLARYYDQKTSAEQSSFSFDFTTSAVGQRAPINAVELNKEILTDPTFWFIVGGFPALLGLFLPLLNLLLMRVSVILTDFENYRTESEYRTHLIIKVFSFRFVCYFSALYYYSYLSVGSDQSIENGILRVGTGVFVYMTVAHWWSIVLSVYFPVLVFHVRRYYHRMSLLEKLRDVEMQEFMLADADEESEDVKAKRVQLVNKRILLEQAQSSIWEEVLLREHDSFPEYIQAVVQFAFVACFSVVLPIAPLICLINHLLSMRFDAYKLCRGRRRPLAQKTGGIGVWEHVLHIVTVIAVLTNCFLMGFTNSLFREIGERVGSLGLFCIVVGWEHVMLLIKYVMHTTISKFPKTVQDEMKKEQYQLERQRNSNLRKKGRRSKKQKSGSHKSRRDSDEMSRASSQYLQKDGLAESSSFEESVKTHESGASDSEQSSLLGPSSNENNAPNQYLPSSLQWKGSRNRNSQPRPSLRQLNQQNSFSGRGQTLTSPKSSCKRQPIPQSQDRAKSGAPTPCQLHMDGEVSQRLNSSHGKPTKELKDETQPARDAYDVSDVLQSFLQDESSPFFEDDDGLFEA